MPYTIKRGERASGSAVVGAAGTATVILNGPFRGYIDVDSIAISCTSSTPLPTCSAYEGSVGAAGRLLAAIRAGDLGTFRGTNDRLNAGQQISLVWTGAAVGSTVRAILRGSEYS